MLGRQPFKIPLADTCGAKAIRLPMVTSTTEGRVLFCFQQWVIRSLVVTPVSGDLSEQHNSDHS